VIIVVVLLAVIAGAFAALSVAQLLLVVYLVRCRKRAAQTIERLSSNVYALAVERSQYMREQKPSLLWYDKGDRVMH